MTDPTRELARRIAGLEKQVRHLNRQPQLAYSSIEDGAIDEYDADGQLVSRTGKQWDGTHGSVALAGPTPPTPAIPVVATVIGGVSVHVTGGWASPGDVAPMDFARFQVEVSDTADFAGTVRRVGITSAAGGDVFVPWAPAGTPLFGRVLARATTGKLSAPSDVAGPVESGAVGLGDLGFDLADYTGSTTVHYAPEGSPPENPSTGDLWLVELDPGPPARQETRRWTGAEWQTLKDQSVTDALATAVAAQQAADSKAKVFDQASEPAWSGPSGSAIWFDTDDGNRQRVWDGAAWADRRLGNGAIQPGSLIASNVLATGTVTAALFEALLVLTNAVVAGDPEHNHVRLDATGLASYAPSPDGQIVETSRFGGQGADRILLTDPVTGSSLASLNEVGYLSVQGASINGTLTVRGNDLTYLIDQAPRGLVGQGGVDTGFGGTSTAAGAFDVQFTAFPGRSYRIWTTPVHLTPSTTSTYTVATLRSRPAADGPPSFATSKTLVSERGSTNLAGGVSVAKLDINVNFDRLFAGTPPTVPTPVRIWLTYGVLSGGGTVGIFGDAAHPVHLFIHDTGVARPYTGVLNDGGGTTATPVRDYQTDWASSWAANWQSNSNARRTDQAELIQGYTSYYPEGGVGIGQIGFGAGSRNDGQITGDFATELAGATIQWAAIFLYSTHWHYSGGGSVLLGGHPYASVPGTKPADWQIGQLRNDNYPNPGGAWLYLPASWYGGLVSGVTKGFTLGDGVSTDPIFYGRFAGDPSDQRRPVVRIAYSK